MKNLLLVAVVVALVGGTAAAVSQSADDDEKPKHSIKDVMNKAHKGGTSSLVRKVIGGDASDDEKKQLVEYYEALGKNKPPKGDQESWEKKTKALLDAAKEVADDKDGGVANLRKASNCMACHSEHRG